MNETLTEENDLFRQSTKKIKQRGADFDINNENLVVYGFAFLQDLNDLGKHLFPSYMDTLVGKGQNDEKQSEDEEIMEEEENYYSSFKIEESQDGPKAWPNIIIFAKEEDKLNKPWKKTLIIKLLGRKINF